MSFTRPTLTEVDARVRSDIEATMDAVPIVRRGTVLASLARGLAGAAVSLFGHINWVYLQIFPDTADSAHLERHAGFYNIIRAEPAPATGTVTLTGATGASIASGTALGDETGLAFETTASAVIASGTAAVPIRASTTGSAGNLDQGTRLVLLSPVTDVDTEGLVASPGLANGADAESDDRLLQRLLARLRRPPHGGAAHDYEVWAKEVPTITRVWVTSESRGAVSVRVVADDKPDGPLPSSGEIAAVQAIIDKATNRPVTAEVTVLAPVLLPVNVALSVTPDTPEIRAAVIVQLSELLTREGAPGTVIPVSHVRESISLTAGEHDHVLTAPAADITPAAGQMPVLGTVVFS